MRRQVLRDFKTHDEIELPRDIDRVRQVVVRKVLFRNQQGVRINPRTIHPLNFICAQFPRHTQPGAMAAPNIKHRLR